MLTRLVIKNFKSIGEKGVDLAMRPLTVLVGTNGSGKSSVLEALALLAANTQQGDDLKLQGELVRFGSYEEIAHKHEIGRWITWEVIMSEDAGVKYQYRPDSGEAIETVIKGGKEVVRFTLEGDRLRGHQLVESLLEARLKAVLGNTLPRIDGRKYDSERNLKLLMASAGTRRPDEQQVPVKLTEAAALVESLGQLMRERVFLLSSLRGDVLPRTDTGGTPRWCGVRGENLLPLLALIHSSSIPGYEEKWEKIQRWAQEFGLLKLKSGFRGANKLEADFTDPELKVNINLAFAGQGSRQVAPMITQLFWSKPDSLIMIEEPELSLHPEAQVKLGGLFAEATAEGKQVMVSTHSHYFLLALGDAVQKGLKVSDIAVFHVTKDKEGTKATPVKLSKRGYPAGWPPSYEKVEREVALGWAKGLPKE